MLLFKGHYLKKKKKQITVGILILRLSFLEEKNAGRFLMVSKKKFDTMEIY